MQHGRKRKHTRIVVETKIRDALLQADTRDGRSFLAILNRVAAILTENPNCFQEERNAFADVKKPASLHPFENRFFALFLHSRFVGAEFHQLTDARRKLEAELESEINPVRRRELERKLDQHIAPIERTGTPISAADLERLALLAKMASRIRQKRSERTPKLKIGPWHEPMTTEDYGLRLGLSRSRVKQLLKSMRPRPKAPRAGRVKSRFTAVTNWRVLRQFLRRTKQSSDWKRDFCLALFDYYRLHPDAKALKALVKVFAGTKFPQTEVRAIADYFSPPAPAAVNDPFAQLFQAKSGS